MARIAGVDLPPNKRLWVGLTAIYGIGQARARSLAEKANVDATKKIKDLTEEEVTRLRAAIETEGRPGSIQNRWRSNGYVGRATRRRVSLAWKPRHSILQPAAHS